MQKRLAEAVKRHRGFLITIAKEQSGRCEITEEFKDGRPVSWFADLVSAGIYGMCDK